MGLFQKYSPSKGVPQKAFQTNQGNGLLMLSTRGIPLILIEKSKLEARELILKKNNDAIAKWLDRRYEARAKIMKALKRNTGQTSMLRYLIPAENRRQNNQAFQTRIQDTRRASLHTSSNTVDGDQ